MFALGDLFSFLLHRDTNLYAMFAYPIGRIYTNVSPVSPRPAYPDIVPQTLLDTLNSRASLKNELSGGLAMETDGVSSPRASSAQDILTEILQSGSRHGQLSTHGRGQTTIPLGGINIKTESHTDAHSADMYPIGKDREFYGA